MFEPYGIAIGPLMIRYYALLIITGAMLGASLAAYRSRQRGLDPEHVWGAFAWALFLGLVGARLWHIFTPPPSMVAVGLTTGYYLTHPLDAIAIWKGGLGLPGAVIGGVLGIYIYTRQNHLPFLIWLDIAAPGAALGQAIGRWGNFINQELYGAPTDLPWAIFIAPENRLPGLKDVAYYHPTFLYESILNLVNMGVLLWLDSRLKHALREGDLFVLYTMNYAIIRFGLEFLRLDSSQLGGLNANQTFMAGVFLVGGVYWLLRLWKMKTRVV